MSDFNWLHDAWTSKKPLNNHVIITNRFDRQDMERMLAEVAQFDRARENLGKFTSTGIEAATDAFMAFFKGMPMRRDINEMDPAYFVNHKVNQELANLPEIERLRRFSVGDDVQAALAVEQIEPDLETLFDRLQQEQARANELRGLLNQLSEATQNKHDIDELVERWKSDNPSQDEATPALPQDLESQQQDVENNLNDLEDEVERLTQALSKDLDRVGTEARLILRGAVERAASQAEDFHNTATSWGLEPGELRRLPADERLALAKKLNTAHFRRIADLFGPMKNLMFTEQTRKVTHTTEEVFDVGIGNDLGRLLPSELLNLELNEDDFLRRYSEGKLLQYEMRGEERLSRGGIIVCEDGSGSMQGENEMWSKAVMLCLLHLARQQNRPFHLIHFGSFKQAQVISFESPTDYTLSKIMDAAELYFGGGTDFFTPMSLALDILREQHNRSGAVKSDVIFITDDQCAVSETFMEEYLQESDRLQFTTYGFAITPYPPHPAGALAQMTTNKVCQIKDLLSGSDIREVFKAL